MTSQSPPGGTLGIGVGLGILSQLYQTRMSRLLAPHDLTTTQFALLSHLMRRGDSQSIGDIANALEINQPGVTKVVRRLEANGLVTVRSSTEDKRMRMVTISARGNQLVEETGLALAIDFDQWFAEWDVGELEQLTELTWRLVGWLDGNRLA